MKSFKDLSILLERSYADISNDKRKLFLDTVKLYVEKFASIVNYYDIASKQGNKVKEIHAKALACTITCQILNFAYGLVPVNSRIRQDLAFNYNLSFSLKKEFELTVESLKNQKKAKNANSQRS